MVDLPEPVLPIPDRLPNRDDLARALDVAKSFLTPVDPYEAAGKMVGQARSGDYLGAAETGVGALPQTGAIKAYHGSPHSFDRFDLSKIGTGEGAQAYGHGLYFADREGVAQSYRDALKGPNELLANGERVDPTFQSVVASGGWGSSPDEIAEKMAAHIERIKSRNLYQSGNEYAAKEAERFENLIPLVQQYAGKQLEWHEPQGHMYEVAIHADPEHFLDWDKPLREQPQNVREWFDSRGITPGFAGNQSGAELYTAENTAFGSQPAVSDAMRKSGIPGIKYLDHGSRFNAVDGKGPQTNTRNYVVFDDKLIDILRKYASGGEVSAPITGEHTITMDDLIGRAPTPASTPGAYTDTGGQKIAAPYVSGMANGYPVYSIPQSGDTAISDALNVARIVGRHKTGTPVYSLAGV